MKQMVLSIKIFILLILFILPCVSVASEKPEIFVQMGHTGTVNSVAFSPDGKYALSASDDNTLKLWEVATGKEIRTFRGHTAVAFSPDGKYALSGSSDATLKLWEVATGKEIRTFGETGGVSSIAFSPDGRYVLSGKWDIYKGHIITLWEVATGKEIRTFRGHKDKVYSITFSPDGRYALSGSWDDTLKLWDIETGMEIRAFTGHKDDVYSVAFSPDGKFALSGSSDNTLKLWDIFTGNEIRTFKEDPSAGRVLSVVFSPDGRYALSGKYDGSLGLWEISTGKEIRTFKKHENYVASVSISPDGRYVLSGSYDNTIKLWDIATGKEIRTFKGYSRGIYSMAISPDGRYALSGSMNNIFKGIQNDVVTLWEVATGNGIRTLIKGTSSNIYGTPVAFSPDSRYALSGSKDGAFRLWEVATGKEIKTFTGDDRSDILSVAFSPDGKYALSRNANTLKLWDIFTGNEVRTFLTNSAHWFDSLAFSPDGKYILGQHKSDQNLYLWEVATGKEIRKFKKRINSVAFSPEGRYVLGFGVDSELWDIATVKTIREFSGRGGDMSGLSVSFSPDGRYALSGSYGKTLKLWDIATGEEIRTFTGHKNTVNLVSFSPDGKHAFSGSEDGTIRIWDISSGKEVVQMVSFTDGEWIVITPEGYYNSSANGDKHLNVRVGNNVYGIDQYRSAFYKPQIVEAALKLGDTQKAVADVVGEQKAALPTVATIQNIEPPFVVIKSPEDGKKVGSINTEISLYIEDRNQTIKKVKVFINGRLVTAEEGRGVKVVGIIPEGKKTMDLKIPVTLEAGENLIEVIAFNGFSEGRKSIRIYSEEKVAAKKGETILPNLWILSIGINKYQDKKLTPLSYAVADADGIVNAFKSQKGKLFREINSLIISDSSSIKPTFDNIIDNLSYVKKAGANDVVLLFIAGHGINDDSGEFYFLPSDAVILEDGAIKKSKAISWREIKAILDIPAKKLIFADTCHSEGVSGKKTRGVDNDRFVKELQEANAVIFTSSRGKELSQESDKWKHGAFTYALIEGIKGKADLIKDNKISMKELDTYVSETVPQITNGAQHPITNTPDGYVNFPVALVE